MSKERTLGPAPRIKLIVAGSIAAYAAASAAIVWRSRGESRGGRSIPGGRVQAILDSLIDERRRLRGARDEASLLEANRIAIVYWQQQLERTPNRRSAPGSSRDVTLSRRRHLAAGGQASGPVGQRSAFGTGAGSAR